MAALSRVWAARYLARERPDKAAVLGPFSLRPARYPRSDRLLAEIHHGPSSRRHRCFSWFWNYLFVPSGSMENQFFRPEMLRSTARISKVIPTGIVTNRCVAAAIGAPPSLVHVGPDHQYDVMHYDGSLLGFRFRQRMRAHIWFGHCASRGGAMDRDLGDRIRALVW